MTTNTLAIVRQEENDARENTLQLKKRLECALFAADILNLVCKPVRRKSTEDEEPIADDESSIDDVSSINGDVIPREWAYECARIDAPLFELMRAKEMLRSDTPPARALCSFLDSTWEMIPSGKELLLLSLAELAELEKKRGKIKKRLTAAEAFVGVICKEQRLRDSIIELFYDVCGIKLLAEYPYYAKNVAEKKVVKGVRRLLVSCRELVADAKQQPEITEQYEYVKQKCEVEIGDVWASVDTLSRIMGYGDRYVALILEQLPDPHGHNKRVYPLSQVLARLFLQGYPKGPPKRPVRDEHQEFELFRPSTNGDIGGLERIS